MRGNGKEGVFKKKIKIKNKGAKKTIIK